MNYHQLCGKESHGTYGTFGININVAAHPKLPDLKDERISRAAYDAVEMVESAVMETIIANDPAAQQRAVEERAALTGLFPNPIFVETIPNGYCNRYCCKHLPWFNVTTKVGVVQIGWRKRVIQIDWSRTVGTKTVVELFDKEDVTKSEKSIHAWSLEKAKEYVAAILA